MKIEEALQIAYTRRERVLRRIAVRQAFWGKLYETHFAHEIPFDNKEVEFLEAIIGELETR